MPLELEQTLQGMPRRKNIRMRQHGSHASCNRLVVVKTEKRIQPHDPFRTAPQRSQFSCQNIGFARVPAVAQNDRKRIPRHRFLGVKPVEIAQRFADLSAAGPTRHNFRERSECVGHFPRSQRVRNIVKHCAENISVGPLEMPFE